MMKIKPILISSAFSIGAVFISSAVLADTTFYVNPVFLGSGETGYIKNCVSGTSELKYGAAKPCTQTLPATITVMNSAKTNSCTLGINSDATAKTGGTCNISTVAGKTFVITGGLKPKTSPQSGFQSVVIQYPSSLLDNVTYPIYVFAQYGSSINSNPTSGDRLPLGVVTAEADDLSTVGFVNTNGQAVALYFYATAGGSYKKCSIHLNNDGAITTNSCVGTASIQGETNENVTVLGFGQSSFENIQSTTALPTGTHTTNDSIARSIEVQNNTSYTYICLKKGQFSATASELQSNCKIGSTEINTVQGDYLTIKKGASANIDVTAELNSIGWGVLGYTNDDSSWNVSGYSLTTNPNRQLQPGAMGTLLEYTTYATGTKSSTGVSDIDISMVNGFNIGLSVYPKNGGVCINGAGPGSKPGAGVYMAIYGASSKPIVKIPNDSTSLSDICPSGDYSVSGVGCMSACSYANAYEDADHQQLSCCAGSFNTPQTCITQSPPSGYGVSPAYSLYNTQLHANSTNAYTFAYDDIYGNFSCDPKLSFVFDITDIY